MFTVGNSLVIFYMKHSKILSAIVLAVCVLVIAIMAFFLGLSLRNSATVNSK